MCAQVQEAKGQTALNVAPLELSVVFSDRISPWPGACQVS